MEKQQELRETKEWWLELDQPRESAALDSYVSMIANRGLRRYRSIMQTGKKEGQTYYTHVLNGVMTLGRLCTLAPLTITDEEARCLYLAFTVHDLNKVPPYDTRQSYANAASREHIEAELDKLGAGEYFPDWQNYLDDIVALAHRHQAHLAITTAGMDRRDCFRLNEREYGRVVQLGNLMEAVDDLALSDTLDERTHKQAFLNKLNSASPTVRYQFVTHRLTEYRGVLTNVLHNSVVQHLHVKYPDCLDLLYYPDGVAYLFPLGQEIMWSDAEIAAVSRRAAERLAKLQGEQLAQFIKARPFGIAVDAAAIESGATGAQLLGTIYAIVARKRYTEEREAQRDNDVRGDLRAALVGGKCAPEVAAQVEALLALSALLPRDEERLRCGEYATAFRNLINDHGSALGFPVKDAWTSLYQALELPAEQYPVYSLVNTYRRGFFIARDIPAHLDNVEALHQRFQALLGGESEEMTNAPNEEHEVSADLTAHLTTYLRHTLGISIASPHPADFSEYLREYVTQRNHQCCNCSSPLPTQDWMTANAPPSIGVQSFSNRLEGASLREPKRQICPICRAQFILERIAWMGHTSKMGLPKTRANGTKSPGYTTFYLYLYPYGYFTEPFLRAWTHEIERLRDQDSTAFLINLPQAFREWSNAGTLGAIPIHLTTTNGVALPRLADATRNVPILPINAPGQNYGEQFVLALEKAVVLRAFFSCKVVLSRLSTPPLDATEVEALFVDGLPRNLLWLVAGTLGGEAPYQHEANLTMAQATALEVRLRQLNELRDLLHIPGTDNDLVHDFATEVGDDRMRLFYALDRAIEAKVAAETRGGGKGGNRIAPELRATALSRKVAPLARALVME